MLNAFLAKIAFFGFVWKEESMSMVNELNSELAMVFLSRAQTDAKFDRKELPAILRQIYLTLRPLSNADRREKITGIPKIEERAAAGNH